MSFAARPPSLRPSFVVLSLMIMTGAALSACAKERFTMSAAESSAVDVRQIFPDPRVASLAEAVADGDAVRVRELAADADLTARGDKGVTLLQWALLNRSVAGMKALLDAGADPSQPGIDGDTVVHLAAMANDPTYLQVLLAHGASPDASNGQTGATPLRAALMAERDEQFRALLAAGADPDRPDRTGNTPLHVAGQINEPARALDLLKAGADPQARNAQGATFQRYLFMTRSALLNADARREREAVEAWLGAHGIPIEDGR
jgi:uncharacterized protein